MMIKIALPTELDKAGEGGKKTQPNETEKGCGKKRRVYSACINGYIVIIKTHHHRVCRVIARVGFKHNSRATDIYRAIRFPHKVNPDYIILRGTKPIVIAYTYVQKYMQIHMNT